MTDEKEIKDCFDKPVAVGDTVKVLGFQDGLFTNMPEDEIVRVKSMLHEELVVEEIDEYGLAWVWKSWPDGEESCNMHGLGLESHEMQLIKSPKN